MGRPLQLYVQDGVSGEAGLLRGRCGSGAVLSWGHRVSHHPFALLALGAGLGVGVPVPLVGTHGVAEPRPCLHPLLRAGLPKL